MDGMVGGDFLDRLAATDHLHGDPGLDLGTVGAALAYQWEPLSGAVPPSEVSDGDCPENTDHLRPNQFYQWMVATAARMLLQGVHVDHGMVAAYLHGFSIVAPRCPSVHIMLSCSSCSADVET